MDPAKGLISSFDGDEEYSAARRITLRASATPALSN